MNGIMNGTRIWYYDNCDKTINIKSKWKQVNSKAHKHKKETGIVVEV